MFECRVPVKLLSLLYIFSQNKIKRILTERETEQKKVLWTVFLFCYDWSNRLSMSGPHSMHELCIEILYTRKRHMFLYTKKMNKIK